jgi:cyclopropane fatty-acyl-phospholipid synthase-like methyltransferase
MDEKLIANLREAYDKRAVWRDERPYPDWKKRERAKFLSYLQLEMKRTLLEIGAGPGRDSHFFQQNGLGVVATDLSPEMVNLCREKGLTAHVMAFTSLSFPEPFDAIFALNCLLHVPKSDLPEILQRLHGLLKPGGLFYMGVYGGQDFEGIYEEDEHDPKRLFSLYTHERIQAVVGRFFRPVYFQPIPLDSTVRTFQSMIWRSHYLPTG